MTKWKCPRCGQWVKEPMEKVCKQCHTDITKSFQRNCKDKEDRGNWGNVNES